MNIIVQEGDVQTAQLSLHADGAVCFADPPQISGPNNYRDSDKQFTVNWLQNFTRFMLCPSVLCVMSDPRFRFEYYDLVTKYTPYRLLQECVWHFTFGNYSEKKFAACHNYVMIFQWGKAPFYNDKNRIPSMRQTVWNDYRANPRGRVPGTVWNEPRVYRHHPERLSRHPQVPLAIPRRVIQTYAKPGQTIIDPFSGSGVVAKVCQQEGYKCYAWDIDPEMVKLTNYRLTKEYDIEYKIKKDRLREGGQFGRS